MVRDISDVNTLRQASERWCNLENNDIARPVNVQTAHTHSHSTQDAISSSSSLPLLGRQTQVSAELGLLGFYAFAL